MIEGVSNNYRRNALSSTTKLQKNHEICKLFLYYFYHSQAFASRCVELRRNDIVKRKRGGDGGDNSIGGKKKFKK